MVESETSALNDKDMYRPDLANEIHSTAFWLLKQQTVYITQYLESKCENRCKLH